jgi:methionine synthase II (cobalamin-independent)
MEAPNARRSARTGRAAQAFRSYKYPNEISLDVQDIHSPRAPTLVEMRDLVARAWNRLDDAPMPALLYNAKHERELAGRHQRAR